jgi:hypothetical protein
VCVVGYLGWLFYASTSWYLSDLYFLLLVGSVPIVLISSEVYESNTSLNFELLVKILVGLLFVDAPIFLGSWWGLYVAKRMNEQRTIHRIGLMIVGILGVCGAAFVLLMAVASVYGLALIAGNMSNAAITLLLIGLGWLVTGGLMLPFWIIENRCRAAEILASAKRFTHRPATPTPTEPHPPAA